MPEFVHFESLRRPPTHGHQDLREWRFRDRWRHYDQGTVLAWANKDGCVLHEASCSHSSQTEEATAKGRMADARALFQTEQPNGTFRYFGFCGRCLTERVPNFGWEPTEHDKQLLQKLRQILTDMRLLDERPITKQELIARMRRGGGGTLSPKEFERLMQYYEASLDDEDPDLSGLVVMR